ncbi:MAG: alpha-galactosidase [Clostridia bacterium]|nr:alpha-galactosidase [Clostridia bacterium]
MTAVFVSAESDTPFVPEKAAEIFISGIKNMPYVAIHSAHHLVQYWNKPFFGTEFKDVPVYTRAILWKEENLYRAILTCCGDVYRTDLVGSEAGLLAVVYDMCEGRTEIPETLCMLTATGENPLTLFADCTAYAKKLLGRPLMREERKYPEIFEYLGWCSWDAFQVDVSEEKLIQKCEEFRPKNIPVRWAILDDMWADCTIIDDMNLPYEERLTKRHQSKLNSFEGSLRRFPDGLKHCVDKMKAYDMEVGIWYPTTGFWDGINPESELYETYKEHLFVNNLGQVQPKFTYNNPFYAGFNAFLKDCGVSFIKVDNQSSFHRNYGQMSLGEMGKKQQQSIESAAKKYFDNALINCMGLAPENVWHRPESGITRCSDDFLPENKAWFKKHILQCAYTCLYLGCMMYCDYDMWWTDDGQAGKNSLLRAVSGGPIYVSDTLDRSVADVLKPLCLKDGRLLRCKRPGIPAADCLLRDPTEAECGFKMHNITRNGGVVAVFNLQDDKAVPTSVSKDDIYDLAEGNYYIYEYFSGKTYLTDKAETVLKDDSYYNLYSFMPEINGIAFIVLYEKMIAGESYVHNGGNCYTLKECGNCAFISNKNVKAVLVDGRKTDFEQKNNLCTFKAEGVIVEIIT